MMKPACFIEGCQEVISGESPVISTKSCQKSSCLKCLEKILSLQEEKKWVSFKCKFCDDMHEFDYDHILVLAKLFARCFDPTTPSHSNILESNNVFFKNHKE